MKFKVSSAEDLGNALKQAMSEFNYAFEGEIDQSMAVVSQQAFEKAKDLAASRLVRTKQQYIDALTLEKLGDSVYAVRLDESAVHLEEGYDRFDMKPGLLHLGKELAGGKKNGIRVSKEGYRYRAIAFEHGQAPAADSHPLNKAPVQIGKPNQTTMGNMAGDLKTLIKQAGWKNTAKDASGNAIMGKVGTIKINPLNTMKAIRTDSDGNKHLMDLKKPLDSRQVGITKFQFQVGKQVKSAYMTFRMVSENPSQQSKWWHPGYTGAKILDDVQRWTEEAFGRMVEDIFQKAG